MVRAFLDFTDAANLDLSIGQEPETCMVMQALRIDEGENAWLYSGIQEPLHLRR